METRRNIVMKETHWTVITEHWYMCIGCDHRCKAIGFKHPMVQGDSCGGTLGRRQEIQVLLKNREVDYEKRLSS